MNALAIETSGRTGSVALVREGAVVAEDRFEHGLQHAARMLPMIDRLCAAQGWTPREIGEIYVSVGPGSFTGLRIGITMAKTLSLVTGARIVAVPSLRVLVENAPEEARHVILVIDAKRGQIFTARYERSADAGWIEREAPRLDTLAAMLARAPRPVHLLGEGLVHHRGAWPAGEESILVTDESAWRARAAVVARLGYRAARSGHFADPFTLTPIYLRKPEAQEIWEQKNPDAV